MFEEKKYYAGVGSRETPEDILELMTKVARYLYFKGYTLRSGAAKGADTAFEVGAGERKEIFLPWENFNGSSSKLFTIPNEALKIAEEQHPNWAACKDYARQLHARNVLQVYGPDLKTYSDFVICWTRGGKLIGGTATAIRLANAQEIPVFNLAIEEHKQRIEKVLKG